MHRRSTLSLAACAAILSLVPSWAAAQAFPQKPITFVVPFAAGSATDQIARAIANGITQETKQPVVIDNKPGASGFIASVQVAKAAPDGYTVLVTTNTTHAANEHLFKKLPYDPVKDFAPITALGKGGQIMVVRPEFPAKTVAEFVALAKKEPGKHSFGSGSSSSRMAGELLQQMADIKLLHVPYKSNPLAVTDLLGGQIDMMITDTATGLPQTKAGKLRAIGMSSSKRSPLAPDVPTIAEAGVPGYEMGYWFAAYTPAHTPPAVVKKLNELMAGAAKSDAARTGFYEPTGTELFLNSPEEMAKFQVVEAQKWGRIIKAAGIEAE
jgi:tripartite-type tricarboxylate transporter receptor subunit TctC